MATSTFRRTVNEEPTDDWTVEEFLQWRLLQSYKATEESYEQSVRGLMEMFASGENELWEAHRHRLENENTNKASMPPPKAVQSIHIKITSGFYQGKSATLTPSERTPCFIGRSTSKQFKERGISLSKDAEVSTTHGKFQKIGTKMYYTDVGSTNGSFLNGKEVEPTVAVELHTGDVILCGQTKMEIALI